MKTSIPLSSYLVAPASAVQRSLRRHGWRLLLPRHLPSLGISIGVGSWLMVLVIAAWSATQHSLTLPSGLSSGTALASAQHPASLAVATLASGPTGNLLPPGTLAAYGTYANTYSRGQCTWYVASRRPMPNGWGNANQWYYRAQAAGWSVGSVPAVGAIGWTSAGAFGHVTVVEAVSGSQVMVAEMNYNGPYQIDRRWAAASSFRYIY